MPAALGGPNRSPVQGLSWPNVLFVKSSVELLLVEKRSGQRPPRDLADLQTHEAGQTGQPIQGSNASAEIPAGHLRVSHHSPFLKKLVSL